MEEDSKKPLSDYTFEEFKELHPDDQDDLEIEADEADEADEAGEWDAWANKYKLEIEEADRKEKADDRRSCIYNFVLFPIGFIAIFLLILWIFARIP
jgi:hypothetical protein